MATLTVWHSINTGKMENEKEKEEPKVQAPCWLSVGDGVQAGVLIVCIFVGVFFGSFRTPICYLITCD